MATPISNVYDHVAMRRAYDDATVCAVLDAGYDEDTRTVDAKIALSIAAIGDGVRGARGDDDERRDAMGVRGGVRRARVRGAVRGEVRGARRAAADASAEGSIAMDANRRRGRETNGRGMG